MAKQKGAVTEASVLERLRRICGALPGADETVTFGHPTFQVKRKTFAVLEEYKGELSICIQAGKLLQGAFLADPRFYSTPYSGKYGWVSLKVHAAPLDWNEIQGLIRQSYELIGSPAKGRK